MNLTQIMTRARQENHLSSALLELTYRCNLACQFCYNDLDATGRHLSLGDYKKLLDDLADMGTLGLAFSGGEPLVHPEFFELGAYARAKGFSITVKSNGVTLNETNAQRLREEVDPWMIEMSLHGATAQTHDAQTLQKGSFERMLKNIRFMRGLGLRMKLNSALTRLNENEVEDMFLLADELGLPLRFDPEITPRDNGDRSPLLLTASQAGKENMFRISMERTRKCVAAGANKMQTLLVRGPNEAAKSDRVKNCGSGSTTLTVDPFGNVYPCVQFRRKVGNLHEHSVRDIWENSSVLSDIRELAYQARDEAVAIGMENYCMGTAELVTGSPLKIHAAAKENAGIVLRVQQKMP